MKEALAGTALKEAAERFRARVRAIIIDHSHTHKSRLDLILDECHEPQLIRALEDAEKTFRARRISDGNHHLPTGGKTMDPLEVLGNARKTLLTRGWTPTSEGGKPPFGPEEGPLTLNQALWRGGTEATGKCHVGSIGEAADLLADHAGVERDSFAALSAWARTLDATRLDHELLWCIAGELDRIDRGTTASPLTPTPKQRLTG